MNANTLRTKWAALPGVKFPEQRRAEERAEEAAKAPDPQTWMTVTEGTKSAGLTRSAFRSYCRKHKIACIRYRGADGVPRNYYSREEVEKHVKARKGTNGPAEDGALLNYIPEGYIHYSEAVARLGCARSSIFRLLSRKMLRSVYYTRPGKPTMRLICAEDLPKASEWLAENKRYQQSRQRKA